MIKRRQNNRVRKNNQHKTNPMIQMSKNISLFGKSTSAWININYPVQIYSYNTSDLYSFASGADTREIGFSTITAATEFLNFSTVYTNYRLHSVSMLVSPTTKAPTDPLPILYVGIDPEAVTGNPTNSDFILKDQNKAISALSTGIRSVNFRFPGVGLSSNLWLPVGIAPGGSLHIGNNSTMGLFSTTQLQFDGSVSLQIEFNNIK